MPDDSVKFEHIDQESLDNGMPQEAPPLPNAEEDQSMPPEVDVSERHFVGQPPAEPSKLELTDSSETPLSISEDDGGLVIAEDDNLCQ